MLCYYSKTDLTMSRDGGVVPRQAHNLKTPVQIRVPQPKMLNPIISKVSLDDYVKTQNVVFIDLVEKGLFTEEDYLILREAFGYLGGIKRIKNVLGNLKNFPRMVGNLDQILLNQFRDFNRHSHDKAVPLRDRYPITDYINKASIIASFLPESVLEIGTYYGWGAASIKTACPLATVYTMNPRETGGANNPLAKEEIGSVCRKKGLDIIQIWADSTNFNYSALPGIDVSYIDGNHEYNYVYKDLENLVRITRKAIVLDDYIPTKDSPRGGVRAWGPWNESVVRAVNDFTLSNFDIIKSAYWIENTPICVIHL